MAGNTEAAETYKLAVWDPAVYAVEVIRGIVSRQNKSPDEIKSRIKEGTYNNTSKALSASYTAVIKTYTNAFAAEFEPVIPEERSLKQKKAVYTYSNSGGFPPHLLQSVPQEKIFDDADVKIVKRLVYGNYNAFARGLSRAQYLLPCTLPQTIKDYKIPKSFAELEQNNVKLRIEKRSVWAGVNIADRPKNDWFTDAVFAQQQFTGTNPTTITLASPEWITRFTKAAHSQSNNAVEQLLSQSSPGSFYVQDTSYFRKAFGIKNEDPVYVKGGLNSYGDRYTGCPVSIFQLDPQGRLHPLGIVLDYKGSIENSIVIFNKRLRVTDPGDEANDWPWRYAKNTVQVSEWIRHEIQIHLTETHFLEESLIVATHRNFDTSHLVYRLLSPHWVKTLSLNSAGREALIPHIIVPITGIDEGAVKGLINYAYSNYDWEGKYIPNDLKKRGFPLSQLGDPRCRCDKNCSTVSGEECKQGCGSDCHQKCDPKFHNYAYARNMKLMWSVLRAFVKGYLSSGGEQSGFVNDKQVAMDKSIEAWYTELRSATGGQLSTFPRIQTVDQLVDAVTMCIHIASPLHTAVNYLQEYYQSFVANKPPALCTPLPRSLEELNKYKEQDVLNSLPVARPLEWLIASHVPTMLSMKPAEDFNLVHHANSVYQAAEADPVIRKAAKEFLQELWLLGDTYDPNSDETDPDDETKKRVKKGVFTLHSEQLDDQESPYMVMDPADTAVSILI